MRDRLLHALCLVLWVLAMDPFSFAADVDGPGSGLVGHWTFDECSWAGDCVTADMTDGSGLGLYRR